MTPKFEPSAYQQAIFDWVVNGRGDAVVQAVAGCLAGNTMIGANRGGKSYQVRLDHLVYMMNGGSAGGKSFDTAIPTKVRSLIEKEHQIIGLNEVARAIYSGEKLTYTVETQSGKSVRATANHQFLTDKGWRKLKDLACGDILLTDAGRSKKQGSSKPYYTRSFGLKNHPYHHSSGRDGYVWNHRLVAEARLNEVSVEDFKNKIRKGNIEDLQFLDSKVWIVHHIDENSTNNHPDNLEVMTVEEHYNHHAADGGWRHVQFKVAADPIKSITEYGIEHTYDLTMANQQCPNFLANGIVVHNSGKTTTLVQAAKLLNSSKATFLAFNKHVTKELQERLGKSMVCKTIHSVGMGTLRSHLGKVSVDENKYYDLAKSYGKEIAEGLAYKYQADLRQWAKSRARDVPEPKEPPKAGFITNQLKQLAHFCMVTLTAATDKAAVEEMVDRFGCLDDSLNLDLLHYALINLMREGERLAANRGSINYDDMLWLPNKWGLEPSKQEWVFIDECVTGDTLVTLADGSQMPIQTIVEQRLPISVLCYNKQTSKIEAKPVTGWRKVPRRGRQIMQIGDLKATFDHPVYTKEHGFISTKSILADGNTHVMVLDSEKVRSERAINGQGAVNYYRWATWRCVDRQGKLEGQARERQSKVYSRTSSTTLPGMETIGTSSLGRYSDINTATENGIWWNCLSIQHFNSSGIYGNLPFNQTRWWQKTDNSSIAPIPKQFSDCCLVYGRWNHVSIPCSYSGLQLSSRRFDTGCRLFDTKTDVLQAVKNQQGERTYVQCRRDESINKSSISSYSSQPKLQIRNDADWNLLALWNRVSIQEGLQTQNNLQQQLQRETRTHETEIKQDEWVYCLDVADNHNFFADNILIHNCQDLSAAQLDLVLKLRGRGGRMLFVGDPKQAIYGFAGACSDSIERIIEQTEAIVLPLSICYRCPSKHVTLAKQLVPQIESKPDAPEGIIDYIPYKKVSEVISEGDLIVSRCTAPAVRLCIELIAKRIPARVRGRDIGRALTALVREVAEHPNFDFNKFGKFLNEYRNTKIAKLEQKRNSESQIESLRDRCEGITVCWQSFNSATLDEFCHEIEELFSDSRSSVVLSTVHRAKGLEEKRVFILRPDQLPMRWLNQQPWEAEQEKNLRYVALTRAKEALYFVKDEPEEDSSEATVILQAEGDRAYEGFLQKL